MSESKDPKEIQQQAVFDQMSRARSEWKKTVEVVGGLIDKLDEVIRELRDRPEAKNIVSKIQQFRGDIIQDGSKLLED